MTTPATATPPTLGATSPPPPDAGSVPQPTRQRVRQPAHHESHKVNHPPTDKKKHKKKLVQGRREEADAPTRGAQEGRPAHRRARRWPAQRPKVKKTARKPSSHQLSFVPASFVKRSPSALATGLNLAALLGLLVFSSLALWLVTSELSEFKAGARRQRAHRIAGVTENR